MGVLLVSLLLGLPHCKLVRIFKKNSTKLWTSCHPQTCWEIPFTKRFPARNLHLSGISPCFSHVFFSMSAIALAFVQVLVNGQLLKPDEQRRWICLPNTTWNTCPIKHIGRYKIPQAKRGLKPLQRVDIANELALAYGFARTIHHDHFVPWYGRIFFFDCSTTITIFYYLTRVWYDEQYSDTISICSNIYHGFFQWQFVWYPLFLLTSSYYCCLYSTIRFTAPWSKLGFYSQGPGGHKIWFSNGFP